MNMYNMLFGVNKEFEVLLKVLGITKDKCGRFRDCYVEDENIIVYTRNGGGNREEYQNILNELAKHPNYIKDYDDDFDCTYCYIVFSIPEEYYHDVMSLELDDFKPSDKWKTLLGIAEPQKNEEVKD